MKYFLDILNIYLYICGEEENIKNSSLIYW